MLPVSDGAVYAMAVDGTDLQQVEEVNADGPIAWNATG
jgi:hypothetical protein